MSEKLKFKQGDLVNFTITPELHGIAEVVGVATTDMAVLGRHYIIRVVETTGSVEIPNEEYKFNTIVCPEIHLECRL